MLMKSKFTQRGYCFNMIIMEELEQDSLYPLLEHRDIYVPAEVWTSDLLHRKHSSKELSRQLTVLLVIRTSTWGLYIVHYHKEITWLATAVTWSTSRISEEVPWYIGWRTWSALSDHVLHIFMLHEQHNWYFLKIHEALRDIIGLCCHMINSRIVHD
jgi:hypothetical protein